MINYILPLTARDIRNATTSVAKGLGASTFALTLLLCGSGVLDQSPAAKNSVILLAGFTMLTAVATIRHNEQAEENERHPNPADWRLRL
jgi:hypothetical protein